MADFSAYNPWAAPVFPNRDDNAMQPETYSNPLAQGLLSQLAGAIGRGFMAPGQALASTTPITSGQMVAPAMDMAGMTTLGAGAVPQEANTLNMGIKAYHGSPHDFNAFDLSKIGTGEGAQAYGHGLYFADNEGVAKSYRDALAGQVSNADRNQQLSALAQEMDKYKVQGSYRKFNDPRGEAAAAEYDRIMQERAADKGRMYEVNINADPAHFLDWDKPLAQQSPEVQAALGLRSTEQLGPNGYLMKSDKLGGWHDPDKTAGNFYGMLERQMGGQRPLAGGAYSVPYTDAGAATNTLRDAGIPGIKYLDQGSRGAGEGSSNYVVFNDKLIDILRKYAVPGMMGAPIFASQLGEQKS